MALGAAPSNLSRFSDGISVGSAGALYRNTLATTAYRMMTQMTRSGMSMSTQPQPCIPSPTF